MLESKLTTNIRNVFIYGIYLIEERIVPTTASTRSVIRPEVWARQHYVALDTDDEAYL